MDYDFAFYVPFRSNSVILEQFREMVELIRDK